MWLKETIENYAKPLQPFPTYSFGQTGLFDLSTGAPLANPSDGNDANGAKIVAVADWGTGTGAAAAVAQLMELENGNLTVHLGDVYYVGTEQQFQVNVAGKPPGDYAQGVRFPKGSHSTFLMNGNHEMISGGSGLFKVGFSYSGQSTTYGVWQSDNWRFVVLDSGYDCYVTDADGSRVFSMEQKNLQQNNAPQPQQIVDWLVNVVKLGDEDDTRGIVVFTHHQPVSDWDSPVYQGTAKQLNDILPAGKQVVWFFGHEHRLAFYDWLELSGMTYSFLPRMVGNGGFPDKTVGPILGTGQLVTYDARVYTTIPQVPMSAFTATFNGFFSITTRGTTITVKYVTGKCAVSGCANGYDESEGTVVAMETITVDRETGDLTQQWTDFGPSSEGLTWIKQPSGPTSYDASGPQVSQVDMPPGSYSGGFCSISHGSRCPGN
jgi:3',5'-cyclic AMP phosphodiesterase CpdA